MFARASCVAVTIIAVFCVYTYAQFVSVACLNCICEINTGCNTTFGCRGPICGPFSITRPFWIDAGKPTLRGDFSTDNDAYPRCANNLYCASYTVQAYMTKFGQDCTGNGVIDCDDYVRLHRYGISGCTNHLSTDYETKYRLCLQSYPSQWPSLHEVSLARPDLCPDLK